MLELIDGHTHIGAYNNGPGSINYLEKLMNRNGITKAITFPLPIQGFNKKEYTNLTKSVLNIERNGFYKGIIIYPRLTQANELEQILKKYELFSVKIHSNKHHNYDYLKLINSDILDVIEKYEIPIVCHTNPIGDEASPEKVCKLAKSYPKIPVIITHLAWLHEETLEKISKTKNLFLDIAPLCFISKNSGLVFGKKITPYEIIEKIKIVPENKITWGTDYPSMYFYEDHKTASYSEEADFIRNALEPKVINDNAKAIFKLK